MTSTPVHIGSWEWNICTDELQLDTQIQSLYSLDQNAPMSLEQWQSFIFKKNKVQFFTLANDNNSNEFEIILQVTFPNQSHILHKLTGYIQRNAQGKAVLVMGDCWSIPFQPLNEYVLITQTIFQHCSQAIVIADATMHITKVNHRFTEITGYQDTEVLGKKPKVFVKSNLQNALFYKKMRTCLQEQGYWEGEIWSQRKNGEIYPLWESVTALKDAGGNISSYIALFSDISEHKHTQSHISYLTNYDTLTGLPNRFSLSRQLDELLPIIARNNKLAALLFIDIDHFKTVINSLGHAAGDKILVEIAKILANAVYAQDITARLGGDEFAILLTNLPIDRNAAIQTVKQVGDKIRHRLSNPINMMGHNIVISCSIGVVFFPTDADSSEQLFKLADAALQQAKQEGRDQVQFITPAIAENANRRMILLSALNFALALGEFVLLFQPQFNQTHKLISAEVLLRWESNGQTMAYPDEFIPLAEENGSIVSIGIWIMRTVCQKIQEWIYQGLMEKNQYIAINISPRQFIQPDFVEMVNQIVREFGVEPFNLELELTEGLLIKNVGESISKLEALKAYGFRISIDDFGTGYSSLAYLKRFPLDTLKIDRSFITTVDTDPSNAGIVEAILAMSKALKLDTVAEGVETQAEFDFLKQHACDLYQGYFFSKPIRLNDFNQLLISLKASVLNLTPLALSEKVN
jgi:diguanylate cyclase (GGDEF)-like protein/PAS domain S-box-containing protein